MKNKVGKNVRGFTLVEIIVVLLVLAIMAAIAIPSMIGYVEKAKESQLVAEARVVYVDAQTESIRFIAKNPGSYKKINGNDRFSPVESYILKYLEKNYPAEIGNGVGYQYFNLEINSNTGSFTNLEYLYRAKKGEKLYHVLINANKNVEIEVAQK